MFGEHLESSKNVQTSIGICPQALIRHFKPIIINHRLPYDMPNTTKDRKNNVRNNMSDRFGYRMVFLVECSEYSSPDFLGLDFSKFHVSGGH